MTFTSQVLTAVLLLSSSAAVVAQKQGKSVKSAKTIKSTPKSDKSSIACPKEPSSRCEPSSEYNDAIVEGNNGYCPGQAEVDAWSAAQILWGNTGYPASLPDNPPPTYDLWDNQNPDVLFCYNSNCGNDPTVTKMEEIINRVGTIAMAYGATYNFEVYDWVSAPGVLMVTDGLETLSDQCGVVFELDFQALYYYNNEGKVTALQTLIFPHVGFENFLVGAFACLFSSRE